MSKERPIIFSGPMVRAILDGRKTMTRRVVKPQPESVCVHGVSPFCGCNPIETTPDGPAVLYACNGECNMQGGEWKPCPYGVPGDRLWVRETFNRDDNDAGAIWYRADHAIVKHHRAIELNAKPYPDVMSPLYMPRWASRITLEVVSVRVQRVHDISEADARAEGAVLVPDSVGDGPWYTHGGDANAYATARNSFWALWDSINAKRGYGWDANPWVWVIEFKQVKQP